MEDNQEKAIQIKDNRLFRPMVFVEKNGKNGNRRMTIQKSTTLTLDNGHIAFASPNPISLFMNICVKEHNKARIIFKDLVIPNIKPGKTYVVTDNDLPRLFDYFEHIQTSIITMYSAIEAFANIAIPNDFEIEKINSKGVKEIWTKETIERWLATSEKIGDIVPKILKVDSPKVSTFWEGFKQLELIRNEIIHQKQSRKDPEDIDSKFLAILLSEKIYDYIKSGLDLITYFCEKDISHSLFPLLFESIIKPIEIEDWDNFFTWVPFKN